MGKRNLNTAESVEPFIIDVAYYDYMHAGTVILPNVKCRNILMKRTSQFRSCEDKQIEACWGIGSDWNTHWMEREYEEEDK